MATRRRSPPAATGNGHEKHGPAGLSHKESSRTWPEATDVPAQKRARLMPSGVSVAFGAGPSRGAVIGWTMVEAG